MPDLMPLTQHFPYAGLFILLILGGLGLPLPEDATLMLCGFLLFNGTVKPVPAFLVVYAGLLLADVMIYWFGRTYGDAITGHRWFQKHPDCFQAGLSKVQSPRTRRFHQAPSPHNRAI